LKADFRERTEEQLSDDRLSKAAGRFLTPRPSVATARDDELLSRGRALDLTCGLAATSWGTGPTVLFAHGWESRRTHWGAFIQPLLEAGFRAVAVDAPAHGESPGTKANVLQYGRLLAEVGHGLGPLAGVVGHSFGAGASVIALHRGLTAERAVFISGPSSVVTVIARWGRHDGLPESDIPAFVRTVEREVGEPVEFMDVTQIVPGLRARALVIHDRNDKEIPLEEGLAVAAAWPGATMLVTERFGHRRIMLAAEVVQAVVAFLRSAPAPQGSALQTEHNR
jgi:pimeloyl-ACP methyl ester carboxylesterase